jgi:hypothetical protein
MRPPLGHLRYPIGKNPYGGSGSKTCVGCGSVLAGDDRAKILFRFRFRIWNGSDPITSDPSTLGKISKEPNS